MSILKDAMAKFAALNTASLDDLNSQNEKARLKAEETAKLVSLQRDAAAEGLAADMAHEFGVKAKVMANVEAAARRQRVIAAMEESRKAVEEMAKEAHKAGLLPSQLKAREDALAAEKADYLGGLRELGLL